MRSSRSQWATSCASRPAVLPRSPLFPGWSELCRLPVEEISGGASWEATHVPGEDLRRHQHVAALLPLLRLRPVLVDTAVLRSVLLCDPLRRRTLHRRHTTRASFDHDRGCAGLGAHRDPRLARDVPGPFRVLAALEVPAAVAPRAPLTDEMRLAVRVDGDEPVRPRGLQQFPGWGPRQQAAAGLRHPGAPWQAPRR